MLYFLGYQTTKLRGCREYNIAARIVARPSCDYDISVVLQLLHWLPVNCPEFYLSHYV